MRVMSLFIFLVIAILGVSFATLNAEMVNVNYYFGTKSLPVSVVIVGSLGLGLFLGLIFSFFKLIKLKSENMRLKSRAKMVEKEVENLRAIPLKNEH